jgi:hypothetical protein
VRLLCAQAAVDAEEFFEKRVRPIFAAKCFSCHTASKLGGLRLDSREAILTGGKSGPAVLPGKPEESLLILAVARQHERLKMPPSDPLPPGEVADLRAWVKAGAVWPARNEAVQGSKKGPDYTITREQRQFWSFQPIRRVVPPPVKNTAWVRGPIDRFVLAKLEEKGLEPVAPATKTALIRRATYDLTGLPPTPNEVQNFLEDTSPSAFEKVVDRLLDSPHYGERWGRYWLDMARYADGKLGASRDTPYENAFRYRDWLIQALNQDLPYNWLLKAQIAGDLFSGPEKDKYLPGVGFQVLGTDANERLDVTTKTFLGLTVGCAQCHDHKYDPIPTKDYYSLYGVFKSSREHQFPLADKGEVERWQKAKKNIDALEEKIDDFIRKRSVELTEILSLDSGRYMLAVWDKLSGGTTDMSGLDPEIFSRWAAYLNGSKKDHPFLKQWEALIQRGPAKVSREEAEKVSHDFQEFTTAVFTAKNEIDDRNYVKLGGAKGVKDERTRQYTNLESLDIEKYYFWRDLASDPFQRNGVYFPGGIYYFGVTNNMRRDFERRGGSVPRVQDIDRFLSGEWKRHLDRMRTELAALQKELPPQYPFLHTMSDVEKPQDAKVHIRGDDKNLGEEVPRHFLSVLCEGDPEAFPKEASGRLQLAEAIARHPLAARVMVNRVWYWHFGQGIVRSPSNFGQLGDRPTHPELLDYLATRLIDSGWSLKTLHREIMLSAVYALSTTQAERNNRVDAENRLLWRANLRQRLDAESLRDSLLFVAGRLSDNAGGPPKPLDKNNTARTIYGYIGRTTLDSMLALFDFPNPNNTSEQRSVTLGPLQRLYFMNNDFVAQQADAFAERVKGLADTDDARIQQAYALAYGRQPSGEEIQMGKGFLRASQGAWSQYAHVLLTSAEFMSVN